MENTASALGTLLVLAVLAAYAVFWVKTLLAIRSSGLDDSSKGMWTLAILVFQLFGPLAWWLGPGSRHRG